MFGSQKLLIDSCVPFPVVDALRRQGHDVRWAADLEPVPADAALLELAEAEERDVMTLDPYLDQALTRWVDRETKPGIVWLKILPIAEMVGHAIKGAVAIPRMRWVQWKHSIRISLHEDGERRGPNGVKDSGKDGRRKH